MSNLTTTLLPIESSIGYSQSHKTLTHCGCKRSEDHPERRPIRERAVKQFPDRSNLDVGSLALCLYTMTGAHGVKELSHLPGS